MLVKKKLMISKLKQLLTQIWVDDILNNSLKIFEKTKVVSSSISNVYR